MNQISKGSNPCLSHSLSRIHLSHFVTLLKRFTSHLTSSFHDRESQQGGSNLVNLLISCLFAVLTFSRVACSLPTQGAAGRRVSLTPLHRCWECQTKLNYTQTQSELKHFSHCHTPHALTHYQS